MVAVSLLSSHSSCEEIMWAELNYEIHALGNSIPLYKFLTTFSIRCNILIHFLIWIVVHDHWVLANILPVLNFRSGWNDLVEYGWNSDLLQLGKDLLEAVELVQYESCLNAALWSMPSCIMSGIFESSQFWSNCAPWNQCNWEQHWLLSKPHC